MVLSRLQQQQSMFAAPEPERAGVAPLVPVACPSVKEPWGTEKDGVYWYQSFWAEMAECIPRDRELVKTLATMEWKRFVKVRRLVLKLSKAKQFDRDDLQVAIS